MLANGQYNRGIKEKGYDRIVEYIEIEGYSTEGVLDSQESKYQPLGLFDHQPNNSQFQMPNWAAECAVEE
ncbi:hypothetical protein L211DRAFT_881266 [Terfezia boudieri ATCC MYA-4762]|uniref:Uncharacterized protein n=1 Tax=Terfezia boudieri ATCC MYA-4762 TaxID=1051890 RepID=A0A3N4M1C8_9PEZI|nr:hypothetical protein L211DRAFT_881266 [Terfezia boudieri ATCC MYA-4762]